MAAPRNRLLPLALGLLALFFVVRAALYDRGVILRNRAFAERLWEGRFLYEGGMHAAYPSAWALAMSPLVVVPVPVARVLWASAQVGAILLAASLLGRLAARAGLPTEPHLGATMLALVGVARFLERDLRGGGPSMLLLALVLLGLFHVIRGRPWTGGALVGLAAGLKLTPALMILFLLWKRCGRAALGAVAALLLTVLAPAPVMGWDAYCRALVFWGRGLWEFLTLTDLHRLDVIVPFTWMDQSLRAALYRFLVHASFEHPLYVDCLRLPPAAAAWIIRGLQASLALGLLAVIRRPAPLESRRFLIEASLMLIASVLLSPVAWRAYYVALLPGLYLLALAWIEARPRGLAAALGAYLVLVVGTSKEVWGDRLVEGVQACYPVTWAALLVAALLVWLRSRSP